jgi:2-dehydropantoate 2-reductase
MLEDPRAPGANPAAITIVGAGAVGCALAAALCDAGSRPALAVRSRFTQLQRVLGDETRSYDVTQITEPPRDASADWLFLCTKAYQTGSAQHWLDALVDCNTTVAVLQNGINHAERVASYCSADQVLPVVVQMASERTAPGSVQQTRAGKLIVPDNDRGRAFAALLKNSNAVDVLCVEDFHSALWHKLTMNAVCGGICALTLRRNEVLGEPTIRHLAKQMMAEVMQVACADGATYPANYVTSALDLISGPVASHWTSIAADRRDGLPMEWQVRNAVVGEIGARHGIQTPLMDVVTALLSAAHSQPSADSAT